MRLKYYRQLEEKDCGPTCLRMICRYYGKEYSIKKLRELCDITRAGTSLQDLKTTSENIGFECLGLKMDLEKLKTISLPVILYWKPAHYVVLYKIEYKRGKCYFHIADPGFGKVKLEVENMKKNWIYNDGKGFVLMLEPTDRFFELEDDSHKKDNELKELWNMYKHKILNYKHKISFALCLAVIAMVTSWILPFFFQKIIDQGVVGKNMQFVWWILLLQFVIAISNFISNSFSSVLLMQTNFKISIQIFANYLHKIIRLPISMFDRKQSSDFIVRMDDINRIQSFITSMGIEFFILISNLIVFSALLIYFNFSIFVVVFILGLLGIIWASFFLKKRKHLDYTLVSLNAENHLSVYEMITEMTEIKANNAQDNKVKQWEKIYKKQSKAFLSTLYLNYWQVLGPQFFSRLENLFTTVICAYLVINGDMTIGTMMGVGFVTAQLSAPMDKFIYFFRNLQDISLSNERVQEIQKMEDEDAYRQLLPPYKLGKGIALRNVSFKYLGSASPLVLKHVSLFIPKNKITAIVGVSGSGKTTLLKLLLGFYSPLSGKIFIDDIDMSEMNLGAWRNKVGVVMQNGYIFSGNILENIALADVNPDADRVKYAAKMACLDHFIEGLPQKYKTKIGKNGIDLSGGQKQRILIARAIYRDPEILLLDEATSALDANTERAIVENLNTTFKGKTVIIIAHRLSTIKSADQIVVIDEGEITEIGTHAMLSESMGEYFKLVKNQLEL